MTIKINDELNRKHTYFNVLSIMEMNVFVYISYNDDRKSEMLLKNSIKQMEVEL